MRAHRLFALLDRLRGNRAPQSAARLAEALDVSVRTLYRDVATLQAMGAPIRGEAGVGYQLEDGFFLPPLHFSADEAEALILGVRLVRARAGAGLAEAADRASAKLSAAMTPGQGEAYLVLPYRAASNGTTEITQAEPQVASLRDAIRSGRKLDIRYLSLGGHLSERRIRPLGLTLFDTVWLLTAWCEERQDFRNLRVDRIEQAEDAGEPFRPERGRRFEDYLARL